MKLTDKRTAVRQLRDKGLISISGIEIAKLSNDDADAILVHHGISVVGDFDEVEAEVEEIAPPPPHLPRQEQPAPPAPTSAQAEALAALLSTLTPPSGNAELLALAERVRAIEQTKPREVAITTPDLGRKEVGVVHKEFQTLLTVLSCGLHAYLVGPAGSFKTSSAEKAAETLELKCSAISVCQQTTAVALLGYMNATGEYVTTEFRKRYEFGGVFILDEIDNGNANVLAVLNSALSNGSCAFPDGMVKRNKEFRLVATANTFGNGANAQYVGRCPLDAATLDRFETIQWGYDSAMELAISTNEAWCKRVQSLRASAERLKSRIVISPRATFSGEKLLAAGLSQSKVEDLRIWNGTSQEEKEKIIAGAR